MNTGKVEKMELKRCQTIASLFLIVLLAVPISVLAGTWSRKTDIPTTQDDHEACVVDGILYSIGGLKGLVQAYDPGTGTWTRKADMPTPRGEVGLGVIDGIIYACGGYTSLLPWPVEFNSCCPIVEAYDPGTDTWTRKADLPVPRRGMKAEVVDGIVYVFGGVYISKNESGGWNWDYQRGRFVQAYDPVTDTWTRKADMPTQHCWFGSCVLNGEIYALTGYQWSGGNKEILADVYDPKSDTWRSIFHPGTKEFASISGFGVGVLENKIYMLGGNNSAGSRMHIYDTVSNTLVEGHIGVPVRAWFAATALNGEIYAIGGQFAGQTSTVQVGTRTDVYNPLAAPPAHQIRDVDSKGKLIVEWGTLKIPK